MTKSKKRKIFTWLASLLIIGILIFILLPMKIGLPPSKTEDEYNLYPDKIEYAYIVDRVGEDVRHSTFYLNQLERLLGDWKFSRYNMLVPFTMTNNYPENEAYAVSISLKYTFLHRNSSLYKFRIFLSPYTLFRYRTSHGHGLPCDYRVHPDRYDSSCYESAPQIRDATFKRETDTCRAYNPYYIHTCNSSSGMFKVNLNPGETSQPFYLDFQIPERDEKYFDTKGQTFYVGVMRGENNYYPVPIQEVVDCRGELMVINEQCHILPRIHTTPD